MEQSDPIVTIIVTHHLDENRKYLDLCLKAALRSKAVPFEVIVLADSETCPNVPDGVTLVYNRELDNATKKVHFGIKMAHPASQYFLILSDDVVISEHLLLSMFTVASANGQDVIQGPMSNNDYGSRYASNLKLKSPLGGEREIPQSANYEDLLDWQEELMQVVSYPGLLVKQDWLCFFCIFIPRSTWNRVGQLDEALDSRHNDQDYCYRAAQLGIPTLVNFGCFAFHFGTKTLNKSCRSGEQAEASEHFLKKWGASHG